MNMGEDMNKRTLSASGLIIAFAGSLLLISGCGGSSGAGEAMTPEKARSAYNDSVVEAVRIADADGDGMISEDELKAYYMDAFAKIDRDGDGDIDTIDHASDLTVTMGDKDQNQDGVLEMEEYLDQQMLEVTGMFTTTDWGDSWGVSAQEVMDTQMK